MDYTSIITSIITALIISGIGWFIAFGRFQEKARELMDNLDEYKPFESLKTYAFDNGIDFRQLLRAENISLRDYYLKQHQEINQ